MCYKCFLSVLVTLVSLCVHLSSGAGTVSFVSDSHTVSEGMPGGQVCVEASMFDAGDSVEVQVTTNDQPPQDIMISPTMLTLTMGSPLNCWTVTAVDDGIFEDDETVTLTLMIVGNPAVTMIILGDQSTTSVTISANGGLTVGLSLDKQQVTEGETVIVTATVNGDSERSFTVTVRLLGSSPDLMVPNANLVLTDSNRMGSWTVIAVNDDKFENNEEVSVTLERQSGSDGVTLGSQASGSVTILDNDGITVEMSVDPSQVTEGSPATIIVEAIGESEIDFNVEVGLDLTAGSPGDLMVPSTPLFLDRTTQSRVWTVTTVDDDIFEEQESFTLALVRISGTDGVILGSQTTGTFKIIDHDRIMLSISLDQNSVTEGGTATVTVEAIGVAERPFEVTVRLIAGSPGDLMVPSTSLTFDQTTRSRTLTVSAVDDDIFENNEEVSLSLTKMSGIERVDLGSRSITIMDNDGLTVGVSLNKQQVTEGGTVIATARVIEQSERDFNVEVRLMGSSQDYSVVPATSLTLDRLRLSDSWTISAKTDGIFESTESFTVTLDRVSGTTEVTLGGQISRTFMIQDNDGVSVGMAESQEQVSEGSAPVMVCADLTGQIDRDVVVRMRTTTLEGFKAATAGVDYNDVDEMKTFTAGGVTSHCVQVETRHDNVYEYWEVFIVTLVSSTTRATVSRGTTDIVISEAEEDSARVSMKETSVMGNEVQGIQVCAVLDGPSGGTGREVVVVLTSNTQGTSTLTFPSPSSVGAEVCTTFHLDDSVFETSPHLGDTVTLSSTQGRVTASGTTTINLNDNDNVILSLSHPPTIEVSEGVGSVDVCARVTAPTGDLGQSVTARLMANRDVTSTKSLTFEAGSTQKCASFTFPDNQMYETSPVLMFTVTLSTNQSRVAVHNGASTTEVRVNDDDNPVIHFQQATYSFKESPEEMEGQVCVVLQGPAGGLSVAVEFVFTVQQMTASAPEDYSVLSTQLTQQFTSSDSVGTAVRCISLMIQDDDISDPDETFRVTVSSTNNIFSVISATVEIIDDDVLPAPTSLMASTITSQSVSLTWEPPDRSSYDADVTLSHYTVEWSTLSGDESAMIGPINGQTMYTIDNLTPYVFYRISVHGNYGGDGAGEKAVINVTTLEEAPSSAPQDVSLSSSTSTFLTVSWRPPAQPNGLITHYTLYVDYGNGSTAALTAMTTMFTISPLRPYQTVSVRVSASTSVGEGPRTSSIEFTTNQARPGPIGTLTIIRVSSTTLRVEWTEPNELNGVLLTYNIIAEEVNSVMQFNTTNLIVTISGLAPYIPYNISVSAVNRAGLGEPFSGVEFTTEGAPSSHPRNIVLTRVSGVRAVVSWTPLNLIEARGFITNYEISYWTVGSDGLDITSLQVTGDMSSVVISGLDPDSQYYITVSASTAVGQSDISTPLLLSLPTTAPSQDQGAVIGATVGTLVTILNLLIVSVCIGAFVYLRRAKTKLSDAEPAHKEDREYEEIKLPGQPSAGGFPTQKCEAYGMFEMRSPGAPSQDPLYEHVA